MTNTAFTTKVAPLHPFPARIVKRVGYGVAEGDCIQDVSGEESRLYVGDDGNVVIEHQLTLAVGEEGEHVFGLRNGCTVIVPPSFKLDAIFLAD